MPKDLVLALGATAAALLAAVAVKQLVVNRNPAFIQSLQGKHVLITGGSSGIGLAIAKQALEEGAFVSIMGRSEANLSKARSTLLETTQRSTDSVFLKAVDVGDGPAITAAVQEAFAWKPIDVLVCNAGIAQSKYFTDFSLKEIESIIQINLLGSLYTAHAALPLMRQRSDSNPSSIVLMNSIAGLMPLYKAVPYSASKWGQRGMAEVLRLELLPHNIRLSVVYPGYTATPMLDVAEGEDEGVKDISSYKGESQAESVEHVASCTLEGVKQGEFHVITRRRAKYVFTFTRGCTPPPTVRECLWDAVVYLPNLLTRYRLNASLERRIRMYESKRQYVSL